MIILSVSIYILFVVMFFFTLKNKSLRMCFIIVWVISIGHGWHWGRYDTIWGRCNSHFGGQYLWRYCLASSAFYTQFGHGPYKSQSLSLLKCKPVCRPYPLGGACCIFFMRVLHWCDRNSPSHCPFHLSEWLGKGQINAFEYSTKINQSISAEVHY